MKQKIQSFFLLLLMIMGVAKVNAQAPESTLICTFTATPVAGYETFCGTATFEEWSDKIVVKNFDGTEGNDLVINWDETGYTTINGEACPWVYMNNAELPYYRASLYATDGYTGGNWTAEEGGSFWIGGYFYKDANDVGTWSYMYWNLTPAATDATLISLAEPSIEMNALETVQLKLNLKHQSDLSSMQMNITLPDGLTMVEAQLGDMAAKVADVAVRQYAGTNKYNVQILTQNQEAFAAAEGHLLSLKVKATKAIEGDSIYVTNIIGSTTAAKKYTLMDAGCGVKANRISPQFSFLKGSQEQPDTIVVTKSDTIAYTCLSKGGIEFQKGGALNGKFSENYEVLSDTTAVVFTAYQDSTNTANALYVYTFESESDSVYNSSRAKVYIYYLNVSHDALQEAIQEAEDFSKSIDEKYADPAKKNLDDAIEEARKALEETDQDKVDNAAGALKDAVKASKALIDAIICYETVTGADVKVYDETHEALYTALKDAIDAVPSDTTELLTTTENAWRQYWYDRLADKVVVATSFSKQMADGEAKTRLLNATHEAETSYTTEIDLTKSSAFYKDAFDALNFEYNTAVKASNTDAKAVLLAQINASKAEKTNTVAYDDAAPNDYLTQLAAYIQTAQKLYDKKQAQTASTLKEYRLAASTLKKNTANVVAADSTYAIGLLKNAISAARTDSATIAILSNVVAEEMGGYIDEAQLTYDAEIAEPSTKTQKEVKAATEALAANKAVVDAHFEAFQEACTELDSVITVCTALKPTFDAVSKGATAYLMEAITEANGVKTSAKKLATETISEAASTLAGKKDTASATNAKAINLNALITTATEAKDNAVNKTVKANIEAAIDAVKPDLNDITKLADDLKADSVKLAKAVKKYVNNDILAQKNALNAVIAAANTAQTTTMAYDEHIEALASCVTTATTLRDRTNPAATAKELKAAKSALTFELDSITGVDDVEALDSLKAVIAEAIALKNEIKQTSTVVAKTLTSAIKKANAVRDDEEATAKMRQEAVSTLQAAMEKANESSAEHDNYLALLKKNIERSIAAKNRFADTHTGVIAQLADAIDVAQAVLADSINKSTKELRAATSTIYYARRAAEAADIQAGNLETAITNATNAKADIVDSDELQKLEKGIAEAKDSLTSKAMTETMYIAAIQKLNDLVVSIQTADANLARTALSKAIAASTTTASTIAYTDDKSALEGYIDEAQTVYDVETKTAREYNEAKTALDSLTAVVFKTDSTLATSELGDSIATATASETTLNAMKDTLALYTAEQAAFKSSVVDPLTRAIAKAQTVQDTKTSTPLVKHNEALALGDSILLANRNYLTFFNTQTQYLANEYTKDKYLDINVRKEVVILDESGIFEEAYSHAEEVYVSVKAKEGIYNVADIIVARKNLETAASRLAEAKAEWTADTLALANKIAEAQTTLATIQIPAHQATYDTLQAAIDEAQAVLEAKKEKTSGELSAATSTLDEAIKAAVVADTKWAFADATPDFKEGTYAAGNVTYTRMGSAIAEDNYGTFCLPMAVATSQFKAVYRPVNVSIYNGETNVLTLFLYRVKDETIPANTPFFARLGATETDTLVLANATETVVPAAAAAINETNIMVFETEGNSTFTALNEDMNFVWSGTLATTTDVENTYLFKRDGNFMKAVGYISPFRACLRRTDKTADVKEINIEVNVGDSDSETTAIQNILKTAGVEAIYTIDGKKVSGMSQKGVYIKNGKKIVK